MKSNIGYALIAVLIVVWFIVMLGVLTPSPSVQLQTPVVPTTTTVVPEPEPPPVVTPPVHPRRQHRRAPYRGIFGEWTAIAA